MKESEIWKRRWTEWGKTTLMKNLLQADAPFCPLSITQICGEEPQRLRMTPSREGQRRMESERRDRTPEYLHAREEMLLARSRRRELNTWSGKQKKDAELLRVCFLRHRQEYDARRTEISCSLLPLREQLRRAREQELLEQAAESSRLAIPEHSAGYPYGRRIPNKRVPWVDDDYGSWRGETRPPRPPTGSEW